MKPTDNQTDHQAREQPSKANKFSPLEDAYNRVIAHAVNGGFSGFGGNCAQAAIAINNVILNSRGSLIGAFNEPLCDHLGLHVGHVAVQLCENGPLLDADGWFKGVDDVETWGMLDPHDHDYGEALKDADIALSEDDYQKVALYVFEDAQDLQNQVALTYDSLSLFEKLLTTALSTCSADDHALLAKLQQLAHPLPSADHPICAAQP